MTREFLVRIDPDGRVVVTWAMPTEDDPKNRNAAIFDRDGIAAEMVRVLMGRAERGQR